MALAIARADKLFKYKKKSGPTSFHDFGSDGHLLDDLTVTGEHLGTLGRRQAVDDLIQRPHDLFLQAGDQCLVYGHVRDRLQNNTIYRVSMRVVHIGIAGWDDLKRRAKAAFKGEYQGEHIGFASMELMHRTLTPNRWAMLRV